MNKDNNKGFTLIELMVTIAIVGIIAAVAYPLYESQSMKQRRSDGIRALTTAQSEMEQFRSDNGIYSGAGLLTNNSIRGYYAIAVTALPNGGENYEVTAVAKTGAEDLQRKDDTCRQLIVNDLGQLSSKHNDNVTITTSKCLPR